MGPEIRAELAAADVVVFCVSAELLDNEYVQQVEIPNAISRHNLGEATVIPVILRPCVWQHHVLGKFQAIPAKDGTVQDYIQAGKVDDVWTEVATAVHKAAQTGRREHRRTLPVAKPPEPNGPVLAVRVTDRATHRPLPDAHVLALYPNKTSRQAKTDAFGGADLRLHSRLPMCVFCAARGYAASVATDQMPNGTLPLALEPRAGGSAIIVNDTGHVPGLQGRINPIRDHLDRMYLYTDSDNIAINDGIVQQPVYFALGDPVRLTDVVGTSATIWFREIKGKSCVFDYQLAAG